MKAQHGYYELKSQKNVIQSRIDVIKNHIGNGSVLDLGCNNGTISNTLLSAGKIQSAKGVELEKLHDHFPVVVGNINSLDIHSLGSFDTILYLNVHHHIMATNKENAQGILNTLLTMAPEMIIDMGSITENGNWGWLNYLKSKYKTDDEIAKDLFNGRPYYKIMRYPYQGGIRTMYKVIGDTLDYEKIEKLRTFRRNVASWPPEKKIYEVKDETSFPDGVPVGSNPRDINSGVIFFTFNCNGKTYFAKRRNKTESTVSYEYIIHDKIRAAGLSDHTIRPIIYSEKFGKVYKFNQDVIMNPLGNAMVVHYRDSRFSELLDREKEILKKIASVQIGLYEPHTTVNDLTDFQYVQTKTGIVTLDFEEFTNGEYLAKKGKKKNKGKI